MGLVTKGALDGGEASTAKFSPGATTEASSELKEIGSDCTTPGLPAEGAALHAEKGSSCGPAGDALGRAEGENKNQLVSGSDLTCLVEEIGGPCGVSVEDARGERSAGKLTAEDGDGNGKGGPLHGQEVLASPRDPGHKAGERVGASSTGGGCSAPERRSAGGPSWQQPQQGIRLSSKVASKHGPPSPRASSVWDMDSLSDEEDGISECEGGRGDAAAEGPVEDNMEGARERLAKARRVPSALPQRLVKQGGKAFEMPPPKRVRVKEPMNGVGEDEVVDGNSGRGSSSASREDVAAVAVALAVAKANEKARQLMPPPPPNVGRAKMRHRRSRVTLMHSPR